MRLSSTVGNRSTVGLYHWLLLLAVSLAGLLVRLDSYPPTWFDEGYTTHAARTLVERGVYGTYTVDGYIPFDVGVTSGPALILPIALSFKLFGVGIAQARLVSVLFTLAAVFGFSRIAAYLYGETAGLLITLLLLATPHVADTGFLFIGRQSLGEPAALGLILPGLWLWFKSWERDNWLPALAAGVLIGLGLIAKMQIAITLVPALTLIALMRWVKGGFHPPREFAAVGAVLTVIILWMLVQQWGTPEITRQQNGMLLLEAVQTYLLTGLFGRTLSNTSLLFTALMLAAALYGLWRVRGLLKTDAPTTTWAETTITLFIGFYVLWFALLSIGWPRYAYAGLVMVCLLLGKLVFDIFQRVSTTLEARWLPYAFPGAIAMLTAAVFVTNIYPALKTPPQEDAPQTARYIALSIPRDAVIESWEWELDALSQHWNYHHPGQGDLYRAALQIFQEGRSNELELDYDLLEADPDYLIVGPFSDFTNIYPTSVVETHFERVTEIGVYRIYRRKHEHEN